jgi:AbrB family looped-hinge helix DNA binding protein
MHVSRLSRKGQVTIPRDVRKRLGLNAGDLVIYEIADGVVTLRRAQPFDIGFHRALSATLQEWASEEDDEAFRDL